MGSFIHISHTGSWRIIIAALAAFGPLCQAAEQKEAKMTLKLQSGVFENDGEIPSRYTREGNDVSPPWSWTSVPESARSLVLIVDDPDAPDPRAPRMTWVHWVLYDMPSDATGLKEGVSLAKKDSGVQKSELVGRRLQTLDQASEELLVLLKRRAK